MNSHDLTKGNLFSTLIRFALPFLGSNLLQTLYGIVDLYIVGQFSDAENLAAVSIGSLIMSTISYLLIGLTTGATVLVGQHIGAGSKKDAEDTIANAFTAFPLIGLGAAVLMFLISVPLLRLMNTPEESFAQTLSYVRICCAGVFFTAGYNTLTAVLRGMGDSNKPLLFVVIACVVNVAGDLLLVAGFGMGASGAAIATAAAQAISLIAGVLYIRRRDFPFDFRLRSFSLRGGNTARLMRLGVPLALQESMITVSFLIVEAVINRMGYIASAGGGICDRVFLIATIPANSFAAATAAMVAQNIGAQEFERCKRCAVISCTASFALSLCIFIWMLFAPRSVAGIFTKDSAVIAAACAYLRISKIEFLMCSVLFCLNGFINGTGHTRFTFWSNLLSSFCIRLPLVFLFAGRPGATLMHVGAALPFSAAAQIIAAAVYLRAGKWRSLSDGDGAIN